MKKIFFNILSVMKITFIIILFIISSFTIFTVFTILKILLSPIEAYKATAEKLLIPAVNILINIKRNGKEK